MTSVDSNFNFLCGHPHRAGPPSPIHMRPPEPDLLPPPCGRHKWMAPNMTFYKTQKLRFNVPDLFANIHVGLFKWNRLTVTSFSPFNNRLIYLGFLFNGSTFQHLKISRHIISASIHFYMHFGV